MENKRKKVLIIFGILILVGVALITVLFLKKTEAPVVVDKPTVEQPSDEKEEDEEEVEEVAQTETAFVTEDEKKEYFMTGVKEPVEKKKGDYSYLLEAEPIPFEPKMPDYWEDEKSQVDKIDGFFDKKPEERAIYLKEKTDFTEDQKIEIEKIKSLNTVMYNAYQTGDYNVFLSNMYKGWRDYYGVFIGKIIKSKEYNEKVLGFYPEIVDTKIGYAYGFMVKEVSFIYKGDVKENRIVDVFVMYKQNEAGQWEVYYEYQLDSTQQ